jgi:hypothetical protein
VDDAEVVVEAVLESLTELQRWMPWCHPNDSVDDEGFVKPKSQSTRLLGRRD